MSDMVYMALKRVVANRPTPTVEFLVDGYSGFLFLDKDGKPKVAMHLQNYMRGMQKKITRIYGRSFPRVTPHVLRHQYVKPTTKTFLENNMVLDAKSRTQLNAQGRHNICIHAQVNLTVAY